MEKHELAGNKMNAAQVLGPAKYLLLCLQCSLNFYIFFAEEEISGESSGQQGMSCEHACR